MNLNIPMHKLLSIAAFFLICSCASDKQEFLPVPEDADKIASESFGVTYIYSDSARLTSNGNEITVGETLRNGSVCSSNISINDKSYTKQNTCFI